MSKLENCPSCRGFVPSAFDACPNCQTKTAGPDRNWLRMGAIGAIGVFGGSAFAMTLMACYGGPCASEGPDGCGRPYDAGGEADAKDDAKEVAPDSAVDSGSGDDTSIDSTPTDAPSDAAAEAAEGG